MPRSTLHPSGPRPWSRPSLLALVAAVAVGACGPADDGRTTAEEAGDSAPPSRGAGEQAGAVAAELWLDDVRIGHQVDPEGAIPGAQEGDEFTPGDRVYVSMEVADAPTNAAVHVVFESATGETLAEDEKKVPMEARYLYFDAGDTTHWEPGAYRVVVAVDGEVVTERELTLTADRRDPG